jgi:hypothetical protein
VKEGEVPMAGTSCLENPNMNDQCGCDDDMHGPKCMCNSRQKFNAAKSTPDKIVCDCE